MKPRKNNEPEFSPDDLVMFMEWFAKQEPIIQEIFTKSPRRAVRAIRSLKLGNDPLDSGPRMRPLYGV